MTDENAEKIEPVPCGWCHTLPDHDGQGLFCWNTNHPRNMHSTVERWNADQQRILSRRRVDFEAGAEFVNNWKLEAQDQVPIWKIREVFNAIVNNR